MIDIARCDFNDGTRCPASVDEIALDERGDVVARVCTQHACALDGDPGMPSTTTWLAEPLAVAAHPAFGYRVACEPLVEAAIVILREQRGEISINTWPARASLVVHNRPETMAP